MAWGYFFLLCVCKFAFSRTEESGTRHGGGGLTLLSFGFLFACLFLSKEAGCNDVARD